MLPAVAGISTLYQTMKTALQPAHAESAAPEQNSNLAGIDKVTISANAVKKIRKVQQANNALKMARAGHPRRKGATKSLSNASSAGNNAKARSFLSTTVTKNMTPGAQALGQINLTV